MVIILQNIKHGPPDENKMDVKMKQNNYFGVRVLFINSANFFFIFCTRPAIHICRRYVQLERAADQLIDSKGASAD